MKKKVIRTIEERRADVGNYEIYRVLPATMLRSVGPFVFLDYAPLVLHPADQPRIVPNGKGAHPHRGMATLTYVLNGEADHFDSCGNHAHVNSGGAQWMKAGKGIIHDEAMNPDPAKNDGLTHGLQFWINLPAKHKSDEPEYLPLQAADLPIVHFPNGRASLKVISGRYGNLVSPIPAYGEQFLYHLHMQPDAFFALDTRARWEYAAFLPGTSKAVINDELYNAQQLLFFDDEKSVIEIYNNMENPIDVILSGGEPIIEPFRAKWNFVMSTMTEIDQAYEDYHAGKYGTIDYQD